MGSNLPPEEMTAHDGRAEGEPIRILGLKAEDAAKHREWLDSRHDVQTADHRDWLMREVIEPDRRWQADVLSELRAIRKAVSGERTPGMKR